MNVATPQAAGGEAELVAALRSGSEEAFLGFVELHHDAMVRVAACHVGSRFLAEEVVQEAWIAILRSLAGFEGRCSLKAWVFRIVANGAKTRAVKEGRSVPMSSLGADEGEEGPAVDPDRFHQGHPEWDGHWSRPPAPFPEDQLLTAEALQIVRRAIDALPVAQKQVITLRDVEQWSSAEVCEALGLTEGNQRVLLHRARSKVRAVLEAELNGEVAP